MSRVSLDLLSGTQGSGVRGLASMQKKWSFYLDAAKRMQEVDGDVARQAAAHPQPKARLRRKLGGRRARRVGLR
eukprot:6478785-Amphidinium_carterae.1